jgi:hypothetical protein
MVSGCSLALQISSMISTSHTSERAQNPRTARTSSTGALSPESTFLNTPSASPLSARVQNDLESLKSVLQTRSETACFREVSIVRNCAQNPRMARTEGTRAVPSESAFSNTPSASSLSARVQNALESLWVNLVASPPTPEPTLHSIGLRGGLVSTQLACSLLVLALTRHKSQKSVCLARQPEATARTDIRFHSCPT